MNDKRKSPKSGVRSPMAQVGFAHHSSHVTCHYFLWFGVLAAGLLAASVAWGDTPGKPSVDSIGNQVMCVCGGCVAPLNQCPMLECAEKAEMRAFIKKEIADGKDETAILQDISIRYGVQALTAPPAKGFNLAVWILPGVGLLAGLGMVVVIVRRWRRKPAIVPVPSSASRDPKVLTAVEEEMKATRLM